MICASLPQGSKPTKVIVSILTDGQENASVEYRCPQIDRMIREGIESGWELIFLAADQDAVEAAAAIGIQRNDAFAFDAGAAGIADATAMMCAEVTRRRSR